MPAYYAMGYLSGVLFTTIREHPHAKTPNARGEPCQQPQRGSWVGTRRSAVWPVSSSPPFSTARATFTAHGSTPAVLLHSLRHEAFLRIAPAYTEHSPCTAGAFAGYLCSGLSAGEGPSPWGCIPVYTAFPCADSYAPSDSPLEHRAFVRRFPLTPSPLRFPSAEESPVFSMEDASRTREVACSSPCPVRALRLPSLCTAGRPG